MPLIIDTTAANRVVSEDEFRQWAADQSVFLSSVMVELAGERRLVAATLEDAGFTVRWFEGFGGTDDPPDIAYLTEVVGSDIYVGIIADDYGTMQKSGFSPTHEEYHEARLHGKRVSFWVKSDDGNRDGHARKFVREVYVFNTAGSFADGPDLAARLIVRLKGMAAEDLSPWVKVDDVIFRAEDIAKLGPLSLSVRGSATRRSCPACAAAPPTTGGAEAARFALRTATVPEPVASRRFRFRPRPPPPKPSPSRCTSSGPPAGIRWQRESTGSPTRRLSRLAFAPDTCTSRCRHSSVG